MYMCVTVQVVWVSLPYNIQYVHIHVEYADTNHDYQYTWYTKG